MLYAVFYRNLNLGRPHCPTRLQLDSAFTEAGAEDATSFLTNGTLVFRSGSLAQARATVQAASAALHDRCGLREPGLVRSLPTLARLAAQQPFAAVDMADVYACCITFLPSPTTRLPALPLASDNRNVELLAHSGGNVLSLCRQVGKSPGSPNAFLEKRLQLLATTRNWNTVLRLLEKFG